MEKTNNSKSVHGQMTIAPCVLLASWLTPLAKKSIAVHEELRAVKII
jgi:hypothetical protein